jgi:hypothetical protein
LVGTLGAAPPVSVSWLNSEHVPVSGITTDVAGRLGTVSLAGLWNIVDVRSPTVARRHADTFGTSIPNRSLTSLSCEVWSNTSEAMWPPRLNDEITSIGTRTPRPSRRGMPSVPGVSEAY